MSKTTREPKQDFGFYASVPRIVRTQYPKLSHAAKWLYVCLKDLCGDKGTCFRTLRSLEEETDISTGSLSRMIPDLHKAGLIHAEKKRRSAAGKEVWHISIVDIWQENAKACSKNEQSNSEVVQNLNDVVQKMNDNPEVCSKNERDCSNFVDRRKNNEERTIEERTGEESVNGDSAKKAKVSQPEKPSPSFSSSKVTAQSEPREKQRDIPQKQPSPLEQVYQDYDHALQEAKIVDTSYKTPRNQSNDREMKNMLDQGAVYQKLLRVIQCLRDDTDDFYRKNINPAFVAKHYAARLNQSSDNNPPSKPISKLRDLRTLAHGGK